MQPVAKLHHVFGGTVYLVTCRKCRWTKELSPDATQPLICVDCGSGNVVEFSWVPPNQLQLPPHWKIRARRMKWPWMGAYRYRGNLGVIVSVSHIQSDHSFWLHVSLSYPNRIPTYHECVMVKDIFIGKDKDAVHVFPRASRHVNFHPYCLHLWHRLDAETVPDLRVGEGMI